VYYAVRSRKINFSSFQPSGEGDSGWFYVLPLPRFSNHEGAAPGLQATERLEGIIIDRPH
jgi:hypothetical protein